MLLARECLPRSRRMGAEERWPEMQPAGRQVTRRWGRRRARGLAVPRLHRRARASPSGGDASCRRHAAARGRRARPPLSLSPQRRGASGRGRRRRPPLPPPPRCPASSLRRAAGCAAGRAGGREGVRPKGVAGRQVSRRSSGAWALRQHHGGAGRVAGPRPAAPAGASACRSGRRLAHLQGRLRAAGGYRSVERESAAEGAAGWRQGMPRQPADRLRAYRRSSPAGWGSLTAAMRPALQWRHRCRLLQTLSARQRAGGAAPGGGGSF